MQAILLHALAVHAVAAAGHLSATRSWHVLAGRRPQPRAGGPAGPDRRCEHHPRLGQVGRADLRRRGPAHLRREDGDRSPQPQHPGGRRGHQYPVGDRRPEPGRRLGRHRGGVPVSPARRAPRRLLPAAAVAIAVAGAGLALLLARGGTAGNSAAPAPEPGRQRPGRRLRSSRRSAWQGCGGATTTASSCRPRLPRDRATPAAAWPRGSPTRRWARCSPR